MAGKGGQVRGGVVLQAIAGEDGVEHATDANVGGYERIVELIGDSIVAFEICESDFELDIAAIIDIVFDVAEDSFLIRIVVDNQGAIDGCGVEMQAGDGADLGDGGHLSEGTEGE